MIKVNFYKGFSLLELLLVLGIVSALIVAAFIVYPKVQSSQRAEQEAKNISAIIAGVESLYAGKADYTGISEVVLINAKLIPANMLIGSGSMTQVYNSFKGIVAVVNASPKGWGIVYDNVPSAECSKISASLSSRISELYINNTLVKARYPTANTTKDFNLAETIKACNDGGEKNRLTMGIY